MLKPQDEEAQDLRKNLMILRDAPAGAQPVSSAQRTPPKAPPAAEPSSPADTSSADGQAANPQSDVEDSSASNAANTDAQNSADSPDYEPLERIARSYDESAFRQAAFAMEQMNAMKLQSLPAPQRASVLARQGDQYVSDGLLLEAQRQFRLALTADPKSAAAYAGLAQVHEYVGSGTLAQQEADKSLQIEPNVNAYLVLARVALSQHSLQAAQQNVDHVLALDPKNSAAKGIQQAIQSRQGNQ